MAEKPNYLLGYGERLTEKLEPPRRPLKKKNPYTFSQAQERLSTRITKTVREIAALPPAACPNNEAVAAVTLHPSYIAKTFFPAPLFRAVGLEPLGSRPVSVIPESGAKVPKKKESGQLSPPIPSATADIFVSGSRRSFQRWAEHFGSWTISTQGADEIIKLEDVHAVAPAEKIRPIRSKTDNPLLEVVLHSGEDYVLEGFRDFLGELDVKVDLDRRIRARGLCFLPVRVPKQLHGQMAQFSFLRVAREMPSLRPLRPVSWTGTLRSFSSPFEIELPDLTPLDKSLRVAIFDGGIPPNILPKELVRRKKTLNVGDAVSDCQAHGFAVTSAALFGPLEKDMPAARPFAAIDHYRVIDKDTAHDPQGHYYDVLNRITDILSQYQFDFVNFSLGPDLPIEDDEVHAWTATLDPYFSDGRTLVTVAAGNTGEDDWAAGNARIQAPADAVNVLSVGASDSLSNKWKRAKYSSIGPGRSPGLIKPDVLAFGGSQSQPFWSLNPTNPKQSFPFQGTSFASPSALRAAIGVKAFLGTVLQPLALKALLIHHSNDADFDPREVGWGRIPSNVEDLILCPDGVVHVLYQGQLEAGKYLRARIPLPASGLLGMVTLKATFCYATETDPHDPLNYTRAGLEVTFRPNKDRFTETEHGLSKNPSTKSFFSAKRYLSEEELRRDAHKWEPCLKSFKTFRASSLKDPVFDIHYSARRAGAADPAAKPIPYALVVGIEAKQVADLYNKIALRYRTQLEELRPTIQIPVRISRS